MAVDKKRILLIDDEPGFVELISLRLSAHNYVVSVACDGEDGLKKAKKKPDLILLDLRLPKINGYEVCRRLRQDEETKQIPIIMLTARDRSQDKVEGLYIGADDYITKPFESEELFARIESVLRRVQSLGEKIKGKARTINEIKRIILEGLVSPVFQPIVYLKQKVLLGVEVLTHLPDKSYFTSSEVLFDSAFQLGLLFELQIVSYKKALAKLGSIVKEKPVFFNTSPYLIPDPGVKGISSFFEEYLKAGTIVLELTERTVINNFDTFFSQLKFFKEQGFKVAIDDVGSGYSTLKAIAEIKPDFIKIDMPLIRGIHMDSEKQNLIKAIVMFCQKSGIVSIAEGIEKEEEVKTLMELGVVAGQGYLLGRPNPDIKKVI